ncbi:Adenylate cyclase [Acidisarcina polymorpha]|uniref:Adenylate cyclase n=1 Tax=Acidisarcina polymorpha TaxID=2211140 RepID=A0A2Z5G1P0_9BACT|nr:malectin domain-containing carbohydrate-binding protein [Acidisarcina polymorpha]AXC12657.1 Adenylate cyclase [Acidisarcina polymorpha]
MQETSVQTSINVERKELESVLSHLERTPRLANLLRYLAERFLEGEGEQLTEYNIATEVFGRKKSEFVASEDAIARVETHRLRKRLKAYYDAEGKDHFIQILIPPGTYVPVFMDRSTEIGSPVEPSSQPGPQQTHKTPRPDLPSNKPPLGARRTGREPSEPPQGAGVAAHYARRLWLYAVCAAAVLVAVLAIYTPVRFKRAEAVKSSALSRPATAFDASSSRTPVPSSVAIPFRLIAGYTGPPQRDSVGDVWQTDQFFQGGWSLRRPAVFLPRTSDPFIYRYGRAGDFSYNIPLKPGIYELHLYFVQPSDTDQSEDAANKSIFNVSINGRLALEALDIVSDAMGRNIADERVLRDISPTSDGVLHLHLSTVVGTPSLSAIQLLSGTPHKQLPIRVIAQPTSFTDAKGQLWHPDNYFMSGRHVSHDLPANAPLDADLYTTERYGHFSYAFPVDPRDRYAVVLHFVELYFGEGEGGAGSRVFRVMCNGNTLLDAFDIYKEVGSLHMLTKTFHDLKPTAQGKLNLTFEPIRNYATVSAIEVIDESN